MNNFALLDAEDNICSLLNKAGIADLVLLKTIKVLRAKFLGSDGLFCFSWICKFCGFNNPFVKITT